MKLGDIYLNNSDCLWKKRKKQTKTTTTHNGVEKGYDKSF